MILFIAKSLSISINNNNLKEIKEVLKSQSIDWDLFVKISTNQLVLPAIFCNYKRKKLLQYLPDELVAYMSEITSINRNRNKLIIEQINLLNNLLKQRGINPIFFKAASNLITNLYNDPAERMIGDIDFLVSKDHYDLVPKILLNNNYQFVSNLDYHFPSFKHYPRLYSDHMIAAVEIHKEMIVEKYASEFNYDTVKNNIIQKNGFSLLNYDDQKAISIISSQINDNEFDYKTVNLKNAYDFLLLNSKDLDNDFVHKFNKLRTSILCFVASINYMFGFKVFEIDETRKVRNYLSLFKSLLHNPLKRNLYSSVINIKLFFIDRIKIIFRSFFKKEYRTWLFKRLSDKQWQRAKFVKFIRKNPRNK